MDEQTDRSMNEGYRESGDNGATFHYNKLLSYGDRHKKMCLKDFLQKLNV